MNSFTPTGFCAVLDPSYNSYRFVKVSHGSVGELTTATGCLCCKQLLRSRARVSRFCRRCGCTGDIWT